ncbi:MAG: SDR family oxidoreductase [Actinomycetota bacterium]
MTDRSVQGRTVCVTGASSGIGRAVAEHLGALGAHVFLMGRTGEPMEASAAVIAEAGGAADVAAFDITDSAALQSWIAGAAEQTGRLDVLVNNAGFGDMGSILDGDPAMWKAMLDVNVLALVVGCQAAVRTMRETGSEGNIVNISSNAAHRRESGVYGATKHAVNCINGTLRAELEDDPIRVTSIMPGVFATNFTRNVDRAMVEGLAAMGGITDLEFDDEGRLPQEQIDGMQAAMSATVGDVDHIARAVEYVVTQPIELNIEELVIRPQKSLF